MPTPTGLPKVGETLILPGGSRWKIIHRDTNNQHCSVRVEDPNDPRGFRIFTEVMYWIRCRGWRVE